MPEATASTTTTWKWLLMRWTPHWYLNACPSARCWPTRSMPFASSTLSTLPFLYPWIPVREKWFQHWERSGNALQPKVRMLEKEKISRKRSVTLTLSHLLLLILLQIYLTVQLLWQLFLLQLQLETLFEWHMTSGRCVYGQNLKYVSIQEILPY